MNVHEIIGGTFLLQAQIISGHLFLQSPVPGKSDSSLEAQMTKDLKLGSSNQAVELVSILNWCWLE